MWTKHAPLILLVMAPLLVAQTEEDPSGNYIGVPDQESSAPREEDPSGNDRGRPEAEEEAQRRAEEEARETAGLQSEAVRRAAQQHAAALEAAGPASDGAELAYQLKVWQALTESAPKIDECVAKHTAVQPAAAGVVELGLTIAKDGRMANVLAKTALPGSERLQKCLRFVAQSWRFPPGPEDVEKLTMTLQIKVARGLKFTLAKPGQKPPERKAGEGQPEEDSGFLQFQPGWGTGFYQ